MASPQLENGYTKIANELIEALCRYVSNPSYLRIGLIIIRLTYGWGRKEAVINLKSIATKLGLGQEYVKNIVVEMENDGMLKVDYEKPYEAKIVFVKDYEQWKFVKTWQLL